MLASITPLGERARGRRWGITVSWYIAASTAGGATLGVLAGAAGQSIPAVAASGRAAALGLVAALAAMALVFDAGIVGLPVPSVHRQVNENWLNRYRGWAYGAGFGAQLGFGVVTVVSTASVYFLVGMSVASASAIAGAAVGSTFGLVRALPILLAGRATTFASLSALHRLVGSWERRAHAMVVVAEAVVGLIAFIGVVGGGPWT